MEKLRVLSLFDGISCGQLALQRAGIPVEIYFASEIDKYAIQITQKNFPNTIQMGDVRNICFESLGRIDLLMGGSPCQDLSIAGKRTGLSGERSGLFFEYVRALETLKPKYFLLENNVGMPKEAYEKISELMGCYPVMINSALVSAQNRKRYYWTNIGPQIFNALGFPTSAIQQPENKGILLKDVLDSGIAVNVRKYAQEIYDVVKKSNCITARDYKGFGNQGQTGVAEPIIYNQYNNLIKKDKSFTLTTNAGCVTSTGGQAVIYQLPRGNNKGGLKTEKAPTITTNKYEHNNLLIEPIKVGEFGNGGQGQRIYSSDAKSTSVVSNDGARNFDASPINLPEYNKSNHQSGKVYSVKDKSVTLMANGGGGGAKTGLYKIDLPDGDYIIRKLTPIECERLQTLPDNYTEIGLKTDFIKILAEKSKKNSKKSIDIDERYIKISDTQRYKCIGNGWTVDVIAHIFSYLKEIENDTKHL